MFFVVSKKHSNAAQGEECRAATGHGGIDGAVVVEGLLDFRQARVLCEDRRLEVVHQQTLPFRNGMGEDLAQGEVRHLRDDAAVGIGRGHGNSGTFGTMPR